LDAFEPLYLITQWFHYYIPERLTQKPEYVFNIVEKYQYHIDTMFNRMYKARIDPNWDEEAKLWFSTI
jgi:TFIIF-interacting CTD phosphatase-like protein